MIGIMKAHGFKVYNPCKLLTTYHIHCSNVRKALQHNESSVKFPPYNLKRFVGHAYPKDKLIYK